MNYSIGLTLRYFIFYKQTQIKGKSIHNTQHKRQHPIPRQYRTPHTAAITIPAFTRYFSMHLHSLPISLLSFPALLTQGATSACYSFTHFLLLSLLTPKRHSSHSVTQDFLPFTTPKRLTFLSLSLTTLPLEPLPGPLSRQFHF